MQREVINFASVVVISKEAAGKGVRCVGWFYAEGRRRTDVTQRLVTSQRAPFRRGPLAASSTRLLSSPSPPSGLLHSCPLHSSNIWSLFSVSNTRATAVTPLLKMPRIGTFCREGEREGKKEKWGGFISRSFLLLRFHTVEVFICPARAPCKLAANLKERCHV